MGIDITGIGSVFDFGTALLDKIFPDKSEAEKAKLQLLSLQQSGELQMIDKRLSAILAEANSTDKWTSRARPSFMYVMYTMILASIPFGIVFAVNPVAAERFVDGFRAFLGAIPDALYDAFWIGFLGYTGARTVEKRSKIINRDK